MTCLWDGQQSTVHGPQHFFLNCKYLFLFSLAKNRIITLIGRGGKDVIPSRSAAPDRDRLFKGGKGPAPQNCGGI
jgi:hypothetical protein